MKSKELHEVLIDYVEGTLSTEKKNEVDLMLTASPEMREEIELLKETFTVLQTEEVSPVPEHYFTNFLPQIREKIDNGENYTFWSIPEWIHSFLRPVMAAIVILTLYGLYYSFNPESISSPIYSLVSEFEQNEITMLMEETSALTLSTAENLLDTKVSDELFGIDASTYQTENEVFALLEEQEAEQVVELFQKNTIP
ncbi:MAG: hypothetical protein WDA22_02200 [Bacteroidota bacterium]